MKIDILEKNYIAREKLKDLIQKKVDRFDKYLGNKATCKVVLSARKEGAYRMEVSIQSKGLFVRSEVESDNMYANLDTCLSKIERQIVKHQDRLNDRKNSVDANDLFFFDDIPTFTPPQISRRKSYELFPISEEEAIEQLELIDHDFYIFLNEKTQKVCVVYQRADGDFGIIETNV